MPIADERPAADSRAPAAPPPARSFPGRERGAAGIGRGPDSRVPLAFHLLALAWVAGVLLLSRRAPAAYEALMQEDNVTEWATVGLFLLAGLLRGRDALARRRVFDGLVALFCVFVAGEEISWGQRLVGYTPPPVFLEHNTQQELTLHNFTAFFGTPKWILAAALAGYGVLLPLASRAAALRRVMERLGATAPPPALVPWFVAAVALLVWYPVTFTGEWVELLAGALFLAAARPRGRTLWLGLAGVAPVALAMTWASGRSRGGAVHVGCAAVETRALLADLGAGAATPQLLGAGRVHKRLLTAASEGYVDGARLGSFGAASCPGTDAAAAVERRRYAVDPWGTAYWILSAPVTDDTRRLVVYSFGPNRRRDGDPESGGGDDVRAESGAVPPASADSAGGR